MNGLPERNASESAPLATLPIGTYREIPLTQGKVAIVDPEDYEWLSQWKWCAEHQKHTWYVKRSVSVNGKRKSIYMPSDILDVPNGMIPDHINHNGLDNRRCNLRVCTPSENQWNQSVSKKAKCSRFKGVSWHKRTQQWEVQIKYKSKNIWIGHFKSEYNAAVAYDLAAIKYFGEFAHTNFKESLRRSIAEGRGEMKYHTDDMRKLSKKAKPHFYRQKALIHKLWYLYPDHTYRLEIEPCVWNEGTPQERKGWPACSGQLTCPFVSCERSDHEHNPLGHCNQECRNPQMKEAIEAWITLNPNIC